MSLQHEYCKLLEHLADLREVIHALHTTVATDCPQKAKLYWLDEIDNHATSLVGAIDETLHTAESARAAAEPPYGFTRVRHALGEVHQGVLRVQNLLIDEIGSYERCRLVHGETRGDKEWERWAEAFLTGLARCRGPLAKSHRSVRHCWLELTDLLTAATPARPQPMISNKRVLI